MGNFRKVKKKVWRLDDLLKIADNELERKAIEFEFEKMATKNSAGELVIDFGEDEINGTWLLINLQARHMERIFEIFWQVGREGFAFAMLFARNGNFETGGVEIHTVGFRTLWIVNRVAENWAANMIHMHTQLMGATGTRLELPLTIKTPGAPSLRLVGQKI